MGVKVALVVDDNTGTRESLRMFLELKGFIVDCCENGQFALDRVKELRFDLILIDYCMPEMNGDEVTRMMRYFCQDAFLIGMSLENSEKEFIAAGADAFISKDRFIQDLASLINTRSSHVTDDS